MADPKHLDIVLSGFDALTDWQIANPDGKLDLAGADLRQACLSEGYDQRRAADLSYVNLRGTNLAGLWLMHVRWVSANLSGANLTGSVLSAENFDSTDMTKANLSGTAWNDAYVSGANLTNAKFHTAGVHYPLFAYAQLHGADFRQAKFGGVISKDVDLSAARNLETVWHMGPSTIGIDTLYRSRGLIPEIFLRGCGIPEAFIRRIPQLIHDEDAENTFSCFISYSTKDEEFANKLHARLVSDNIRVWYAPHDMRGGRKINDQLYHAIRNYDKTLLVFSEDSMNSQWVETEIRNTMAAENLPFVRKLFPIRLVTMAKVRKWQRFDADSRIDLAVRIREYHIPDFSAWRDEVAFERSYVRLIRDLQPWDIRVIPRAPEPSGEAVHNREQDGTS